MTAKRTSWDRQKDRFARMSPEEIEAWKARKSEVSRAYRTKRQLAMGKPAPVPVDELARRREERRLAEEAELQEFLAGGAPTNGYSAFLRSREAAKAAQLNRSLMDERMAA